MFIIIFKGGYCVKITLYNNYSDNNVVSKNINPITTIACELKQDCSMNNPVIIVGYNSLPNWLYANYAYVDIFGRYYYIKDIKIATGSIIEITLQVDVLMSFASQIKGISCVIERQEILTNPYIIDSELPVRSQRFITYKKIGSLGNSHTIVLTVTGGNGGEE